MKGFRKTAIVSMVLLLTAACETTAPERDRVVEFTSERPLNYLVMHDELPPSVVQAAQCYELTAEDSASSINVSLLLNRLIQERLPVLPPCRGGETRRVSIDYHAGYGVNVHGVNPSNPQRSGYAFFSVYGAAGDRLGGGEWDYFRGGTCELMAQQFVFDFTNLYINGLEKPPI